MNPLLQVKLSFTKEKNTPFHNGSSLKTGKKTTAEKIDSLIRNLLDIERYYSNTEKFMNGLLIDVNYCDIIAKSNRIKSLLKPSNGDANSSIVGARFSETPEGRENHIITHYVDKTVVDKTIDTLEKTKQFLIARLDGSADADNFNSIKDNKFYSGFGLSKTTIRDVIVDCSFVESFSVPGISVYSERESLLVTFYKTELSLLDLMERLGIDTYRYFYTIYGENTISVSKELFEILNERIPYMISMISSDLSKITLNDISESKKLTEINIPSPSTEPVIGVIDTLFDENVYFSNWVDNTDCLDDIERMALSGEAREHGTEVSSIIVDGPRLNPWLDDGCGRFRVRHFGVCENRISTAKLIKKIMSIVDSNPDIHVWNLSLGTDDEVSKNFISYDAAFLDSLQARKNVIFVISGTNDNRKIKEGSLRVGSPADSLNSIVVNSVRQDMKSASYSRRGNVLSFFNKPDVSYYGGDWDERIIAYSPSSGEVGVYGTSFAAPWISRKLCYLIDVMGLPREIAKALIIDSAAGWEYKKETYKRQDLVGYGVVPVDIKRILSTQNNEIRFVVYGTSESYKTTNYAIPIPKDEENKYPYISRATLCYFPECNRLQGVDYTSRELSLSFGRIYPNGKIDDINDNVQDNESAYIDERQSRKDFRKWENTKFISKKVKKNSRSLKSYDERLWGMAITSKSRLSAKSDKPLNFGVVITLKEINGINRIDDFIKACTLRGWIVNKIDVENKIEIYNTSQEEIVFE